jgi:hypothetical protein
VRTPTAALRQRIQLRARGANLGDGPTYADPVTVRARVDWGYRLYRDSTGAEVTVEGVMLVRGGTAVTAGDRVTIDGATRTVFSVNPAYGPTGAVRHLEVTFR